MEREARTAERGLSGRARYLVPTAEYLVEHLMCQGGYLWPWILWGSVSQTWDWVSRILCCRVPGLGCMDLYLLRPCLWHCFRRSRWEICPATGVKHINVPMECQLRALSVEERRVSRAASSRQQGLPFSCDRDGERWSKMHVARGIASGTAPLQAMYRWMGLHLVLALRTGRKSEGEREIGREGKQCRAAQYQETARGPGPRMSLGTWNWGRFWGRGRHARDSCSISSQSCRRLPVPAQRKGQEACSATGQSEPPIQPHVLAPPPHSPILRLPSPGRLSLHQPHIALVLDARNGDWPITS